MSFLGFIEQKFNSYNNDKVAIIDADLNQSWTYQDLLFEGQRLAHFLHEKGTKRGDRVAIHSKNRVEHLTLLFACARIGAILVPLNTRLTEREISEILY